VYVLFNFLRLFPPVFLNFTFYSGRVQVEVSAHQFKKLRANEIQNTPFFYIPFLPRFIQFRPHSTTVTSTWSGELKLPMPSHKTHKLLSTTGQAMSYFITNSKSGDIPYTHLIAVGHGLRWHFAFNMDSITSYAKSDAQRQ